jgi:prevent-host-death family protein
MKPEPIRVVNIHEAKTHLSRLVDEAEQGRPFIIAKAGKPKVKVSRIDEPAKTVKSRIGFMKGMYTIPDNFEEIDSRLDKEIEKMFYGEEKE